ncbi:MAG: hypothetical protein Q9161_008596, partial [Pseudevernia consocians]
VSQKDEIGPSTIQPLGRTYFISGRARGLPGSGAKRVKFKALQEIRRYQKRPDLLIPKEPFRRLVREIARDLNIIPREEVRFEPFALEALQEAAEAYLCYMFGNLNLYCTYVRRVTVQKQDVDLWKSLDGPLGV